MTTTPNKEPAGDAASAIAAALTGVGILVTVLFPFAIPILLLTAAFTAPLLVAPLVAVLPLGIAAAAVLALRGLWRRLRAGAAARRRHPERRPAALARRPGPRTPVPGSQPPGR
jgi:uncharacterized membrane protein YbhN (UPF0104 family)